MAPADYQVQSVAQHLSNILIQWWEGTIPKIEIVHSVVGQPQNVNAPVSAGYNLSKIFKAINSPAFAYHLKDLSTIVDSQNGGIVIDPNSDPYKQFLKDAEAAMLK